MSDRTYREGEKIIVIGRFDLDQLHRALAGIHKVVENDTCQKLDLDFSQCNSVHSSAMLAMCARMTKLRYEKIEANLVLPELKELARLFTNANWAHYMSPSEFEPSTFRGYTQVPAINYVTPHEQAQAANRIVNALLGAIPDLERSDFAALEWAINEITDNVLVHAQSTVGGFVQVSTFKRDTKRIAFSVADAGIGIPNTLRENHSHLTSDADALDHAIREGVTRDENVGQGNGLFGSYRICSESGGDFVIDSGRGRLKYTARNGLKVGAEKIPFEGTLVSATVDFSRPHLLEKALSFKGRIHKPTDYLEINYQKYGADDSVYFRLAEESNSFGSRVAGTPLRNRLLNIAKMAPASRIIVDFSGVALISSSFADEVIGKLFLDLGPVAFMSRFQMISVMPTVQSLNRPGF